MRSPAFLILLVLTALCAIVFAIWPQIDLATAKLFYSSAGFAATHSTAWAMIRKAGYWVPAAVLIGFLLLYGLRKVGMIARGPSGRSAAFIALTMALGPGLLVNVILKDHSHRPRPIQVQEFGGSAKFEPWYRFDGACARNCSFVSGEAAGAFWMTAPAMLAPPWIRVAAIAAALAFGAADSLLRLAFGGHFLSDVLFAALFTLLIVVGLAKALGVPDGESPPSRNPRLRERDRSL
ncbi:MAG TPA: phosphatase PAP2 family protein [Beijerinckiaceae bacterium]|nr:phosphatase PAP2 family protein [Beijerinckiaceae bacterium]